MAIGCNILHICSIYYYWPDMVGYSWGTLLVCFLFFYFIFYKELQGCEELEGWMYAFTIVVPVTARQRKVGGWVGVEYSPNNTRESTALQ